MRSLPRLLKGSGIALFFIVGLVLGGTSCKKSNANATCPQGFATCNGQCTATQFDPSNCGACGTTCAAGQVCQSGTCSTSTCMAGFSACGGGCTDVGKDPNNCGVCGKACPAGQLCSAGKCGAGCASGTSACTAAGAASYCANLQSDAQNCSACGKVCPAGQICTAGACQCGFSSISAGKLATCGLRADHTVVCFGVESNGHAGVGESPYIVVVSSAKFVENGWATPCALKTDGTVWCWGDNANGELGNNSTAGSSALPVQVKNGNDSATGDMGAPTTTYLTGVTQLSVGMSHACALDSGGNVWCWGQGSSGELGTGTSDSPFAIKATLTGPTSITKVVAGNQHSCALTMAGNVWCWGDNTNHQLGAPGGPGAVEVLSTGPGSGVDGGVNTVALSGIVDLSTKVDHTCALRNDHTLWCWGDNGDGRLGVGDIAAHTTALQVVNADTSPFTGVATIATGELSTCATKMDGTAWCWGGNTGHNGSPGSTLGDNTTNNSSNPVQVLMAGTTPAPLTGVISITTSHVHSCATVGADGTVYCWGVNHKGQAGLDVVNTGVAMPVATCAQ